jgi:hypothetical protein
MSVSNPGSHCSCVIFQSVKLFIASADELYGPITVLRCDGRITKKIPWSAFKISDVDWARVLTAKSILEVHSPLYLFNSSTACNKVPRILIVSSNTFLLKSNPPYGAHSLPSKSFRRPGKKSETIPTMTSTKPPSMTVSQSSTSTTLGSMRSRAMYWALVSNIICLMDCWCTQIDN